MPPHPDAPPDSGALHAATFERRVVPRPPVQLITGRWRDARDLETRVRAALRGGVRWVQLRAKERSTKEFCEAACLLAPIVREAGGLFVVNDRVDVAAWSGAGGVHLPEAGMTAVDARRLLGAETWVARSTHSIRAIAALAGEPIDAVQLGPVFETASKRGFGSPLGPDALAEAVRVASMPIVAVGGITPARIGECLAARAAAVAMIGAIWDARDVEAAAREAVVAAR
jgi:thiamine-phosphate pyrophosphorylase